MSWVYWVVLAALSLQATYFLVRQWPVFETLSGPQGNQVWSALPYLAKLNFFLGGLGFLFLLATIVALLVRNRLAFLSYVIAAALSMLMTCVGLFILSYDSFLHLVFAAAITLGLTATYYGLMLLGIATICDPLMPAKEKTISLRVFE